MKHRDSTLTELPSVEFLASSYEDIKDRIIAQVETDNLVTKLYEPIFAMNNFNDVWQCWFGTGLNLLVTYEGLRQWNELQPNFVYFLMWAKIIKGDGDLVDDTVGRGLSYELFDDLTARFAKHTHGLDEDMADILKI